METRFDEMKRYVRFTDDDARRLAELREHAAPHFSRIAQEFYERIREHEDAHAVFTSEEQITRLQRSLVGWLERLLGGRYDERYFEQTQQIGRVHVRIGLPQRYMFTAMTLIRASLMAIAAESAAPNTCDALCRVLDLELAIMLESYREDLTARIERASATDGKLSDAREARLARRHADAVELADAMVIGIGRRGEILLFNREAERVTGYARDEAIGHDFAELLLPSDVSEAERSSFRQRPTTGSLQLEVPLRTRSGDLRDTRWRLTGGPSRDDDVEMFAMGHDVTDERAARQRDQQHERLSAVGTLAAGLAHEIRNPLNGALLHLSFLRRSLQERSASQDAREAVSVVEDEIKRLARLVTEFLDFARPHPLVVASTSLKSLCERALGLTSARAGEAITLELDLPANDVVLAADKDRLEQVLLNLLQNAVEAVSPRGGRVTLRARRKPRHAWIEVEDDGPGLPNVNAPVFDAFFSTKPNGTGLGLAIAHRVVTDHGGTIDVESKPGYTRFRVALPLTNQGAGT